MFFADYRFLLCTMNTIHLFIWVPVDNTDVETSFVYVKWIIQIEFLSCEQPG